MSPSVWFVWKCVSFTYAWQLRTFLWDSFSWLDTLLSRNEKLSMPFWKLHDDYYRIITTHGMNFKSKTNSGTETTTTTTTTITAAGGALLFGANHSWFDFQRLCLEGSWYSHHQSASKMNTSSPQTGAKNCLSNFACLSGAPYNVTLCAPPLYSYR